MKKISLIIITLAFANMTMAQNTPTFDEGVEINGVIWATRNVDAPGTFADNPEDAGMFYQWNSNIGWTSNGTAVSTDGSSWNSSWNGNNAIAWETINNPCPCGWRLATDAEIQSLVDIDKVGNEPFTQNNVTGRIFTDNVTGNSLFVPATGYRDIAYGTFISGTGLTGNFWGSASRESLYARRLAYCPLGASWSSANRNYGLPVRCVKENNIPTSVNNISSEKEKNILGYYSILGQELLQEPQSGVYIIRYENGKTEKVVR